jgi:hypothetical protein
MYDLTTLDGGYYAKGGSDLIEGAKKWVSANQTYTLVLLAILIVLVIGLALGYIKPYKERLISGARASIGVGGSNRSDYGTAGDMIIRPNYGGESMTSGEARSRHLGADAYGDGYSARGLSLGQSALPPPQFVATTNAPSVIPGNDCRDNLANGNEAYAWRVQQAYGGEKTESFGLNDSGLTRAMAGL